MVIWIIKDLLYLNCVILWCALIQAKVHTCMSGTNICCKDPSICIIMYTHNIRKWFNPIFLPCIQNELRLLQDQLGVTGSKHH